MLNLLSGLVTGACMIVLWAVLTKPLALCSLNVMLESTVFYNGNGGVAHRMMTCPTHDRHVMGNVDG